MGVGKWILVGVGRDGDVRLCKVPEIFCSL